MVMILSSGGEMPVLRRPYSIARHNTGGLDVIEASGGIGLAVTPNEKDISFLQDVFDDADWKLYQARTYREAMVQLGRYLAPVIMCECQLPDGSWKDVLSQTSPMPERPRLIVISKQANEDLWSE